MLQLSVNDAAVICTVIGLARSRETQVTQRGVQLRCDTSRRRRSRCRRWAGRCRHCSRCWSRPRGPRTTLTRSCWWRRCPHALRRRASRRPSCAEVAGHVDVCSWPALGCMTFALEIEGAVCLFTLRVSPALNTCALLSEHVCSLPLIAYACFAHAEGQSDTGHSSASA